MKSASQKLFHGIIDPRTRKIWSKEFDFWINTVGAILAKVEPHVSNHRQSSR